MLKIGLVWATNVGKSTLFNRLIKQFRAIVTDIPGTTTDVIKHETIIDEIGKVFFCDSPGLLTFKDEFPIIQNIIDDCDLVLFVIDDEVGITAKENAIFEYIMEKNKKSKTILVVNKLDVNYKTHEVDLAISDYYSLWFENIVGISAKNGNNLELLQFEITEFFKKQGIKAKPEDLVEDKDFIPIAIFGKPNSGKSTLLNTLVWEELAKVKDEMGTTRDYITGNFVYNGKKYRLFDTAWLRKKGRIHGIEKIAYDKIKAMLEHIRPVVVFMVDISQWLTQRDFTLMAEVQRLWLSMLLIANKADLFDSRQVKAALKVLEYDMKIWKHIPIIPMVATTWKGTDVLMKMINWIYKESRKRIDTWELNKAISKEWISRPPRFPKNKVCKIFYISQIQVDAPTFMVFVNHMNRVNFALKRWLENSIRNYFGFVWVPVILKFKEREKKPKNKDSEEN